MALIRRVEKYHYITILVMLIILFVLENTQLLGIEDFFSYSALMFLKTVMWVALGLIIKIFPSVMFHGLVRLKSTVISLSFIFAIFYLLVFMLIGFFTAFGKSTYSMSLLGIVSNIFPMCTALIGGEMCRSFLINSLSKRKPYRSIIALSLIFSVFNMSLGNVKGLSDSLDILEYLNNMVFPQMTQNIAASCLVYLSGPLPAIIYLGIIRLFNFLSPYIPNPSEIPRLLFNVLFPLLSIWIVLKVYASEAAITSRNTHKKFDNFGWFAVSTLSVAIVWFSVGLFPIFPSVILTGSMEPKIKPGDVVIVDKTGSDNVNVGDIVMYYSEDEIYITHRVIEEIDSSGQPQFITKGDNNPCADPAIVSAAQVKGRVIGTIPKLGKLALYLRSAQS
ncbi:MAG: signal peptidase I [Oscillospiraceae bacterium]|nr:signal peptidase I [Oscillospiraceae bacterium]